MRVRQICKKKKEKGKNKLKIKRKKKNYPNLIVNRKLIFSDF